MTQTHWKFDGSDYHPARDNPRLTAQQERIFDVVSSGAWFTLRDIAERTDAPEASISAQLRHLRKPRHGGYIVEKEYIGGGLYRYRVLKPEVL